MKKILLFSQVSWIFNLLFSCICTCTNTHQKKGKNVGFANVTNIKSHFRYFVSYHLIPLSFCSVSLHHIEVSVAYVCLIDTFSGVVFPFTEVELVDGLPSHLVKGYSRQIAGPGSVPDSYSLTDLHQEVRIEPGTHTTKEERKE